MMPSWKQWSYWSVQSRLARRAQRKRHARNLFLRTEELESRHLLTAVFQMPGNPGQDMSITFGEPSGVAPGETGDKSKIYMFLVDDAEGSIGGIHPDAGEAYVTAAANSTRWHIYDSHLNSNTTEYHPTKTIEEVPGGSYFSFFATTVKADTGLVHQWFPFPAPNPDGLTHVGCSGTAPPSTGIPPVVTEGECHLEDDFSFNDNNDINIEFVASNALPVVTVEANPVAAQEGDGTHHLAKDGGFVIKISAPPAEEIEVTFELMGTAEEGPTKDFATITHHKVVFSPLDTADKTVTIDVLNDNLPEGMESVLLVLDSSPSYTVGNSSAEVFIYDDEYDSSHPDGGDCDCDCDCEDGTQRAPDVDLNKASGSPKVTLESMPTLPGAAPATASTAGKHHYAGATNPHVIIRAQDVLPADDPLIVKTIKLDLTFNDEFQDTYYYNVDGIARGSAVSYAIPLETSLASGRYKWKLEATYLDVLDTPLSSPTPNTDGKHRLFTGEQVIVNRLESDFGRRWYLDGLDYLAIQNVDDEATPSGVLVVKGNGDTVWFKLNLGTFDRAPGDMSFSTLTYDTVGLRYTLRTKYGDSSIFDNNGKLLARLDRNGNATTYAYDGNGRLTDVTDPYGRKTTYEYGGTYTLLTKIKDFALRETSFEYAERNLEKITYPDPNTGDSTSNVIDLDYDLSDRLEWVEDASGNRTTYTYDDVTNRILSIQKEGSPAQVIEPFDSRGLATTSDDPAVNLMTVALAVGEYQDENANLTKSTFDRLGNALTTEDALGGMTRYYRDRDGLVRMMFEPFVHVVGAALTRYDYDERGNLIYIKYPDGRSETWDYSDDFSLVEEHVDERGKTTLYTYDDWGNLLAERQIMGDDDELETPADPSDLVETNTYTHGGGVHLDFDGVDDRVLMGNVAELKIGTNDYAVAAWIKPHVEERMYIVGQGNAYNSSGHGFYVAYRGDQSPPRLNLAINNGTGSQVEVITTGSLVGEWHHVVAVIENDPVSPSGTYLRVYLDGSQVFQTANNKDGDIQGSIPFVVGAHPSTSPTDFYFDGQIDDVRVYHDALSPGLVKEIYSGTILGAEAAHWRFHEVSGNEASDSAEDGLTGQLSGSTGGLAKWKFSDGPPIVPGGLLQSATDANGNTTQYAYYQVNELTNGIVDVRRGLLRSIVYPDPDGPSGSLPAPISAFVYDAANANLVKSIETTVDDTTWSSTGDWQYRRTTEFQYDVLGRLTRQIDPDPDYISSVSNGPLVSRMLAFDYDYVGNRTKESETTFGVSDPFGTNERVTEYEYDTQNRQILVKMPSPGTDDASGAPLPRAVTVYAYDDAGNLERLIVTTSNDTTPFIDDHADRRVTAYQYDQLNRVQAITHPDPDYVDENNTGLLPSPVTAYVYDARGQLVTVIETTSHDQYPHDPKKRHPDKRLTQFRYNARGQLIREMQPLSGGKQEVEYSFYNEDTEGYDLFVGTEAIPAAVVGYFYDESGNILRRIETNSSDADLWSETETTTRRITGYLYDDAGRLIKTTMPDPDLAGGTLPAPLRVSVYDAAGNVITSIETTTADTEPLNPESEHADKRITTNAYDALSRLTATTLPDPDGDGPLPAPVQASVFDAMGNVAESILTSSDDDLADPSHFDRRSTTYAYDKIHRATGETQPDPDGSGGAAIGATMTYEYDSIGDLIKVTDPRDGETEYIYDRLHRQIKIVSPEPDVTLPSLVTAYHYDSVGDVVYEIETTADDTHVFDIDYTADGDYAFKRVTQNVYDKAHRLIKIVQPDPDLQRATATVGPLASPEWEYRYDQYGDLVEVTDPRDFKTEYKYDKVHRQISEIQSISPDQTGVPLPIDNGGSGFTTGGASWGSAVAPGGQGANQLIRSTTTSTSGSSTATWAFSGLTLGVRYEVLVSWNNASGEGANDAVFQLFDGIVEDSDQLGFVRVDQSREPGTHRVAGVGWASIGSVTLEEATTLAVRLTTAGGQAGKKVYADAVKLIKASAQTDTSYDINGDVSEMRDPRGNITSYQYDGLHRQTLVTYPDPDDAPGDPSPSGLPAPISAYVYNSVGNLAYSIATTVGDSDIFNPAGSFTHKRVTAFEYDQLHRTIESTLPDPGSASHEQSQVQEYSYDSRGRLASTMSRAASTGADTDRLVGYGYDKADRPTDTWTFAANGVRGDYYLPEISETFDSLPDFEDREVFRTRNDTKVDFNTENFINEGSETYDGDFAVRWTGAMYAPMDGVYNFSILNIDSDDSARLLVNGAVVIAEDGTANALTLEKGMYFYQFDYAKTGTTSSGVRIRYNGQTPPGVSPVVSTTGTPDNGFAIRDAVEFNSAGDTVATIDPLGRRTEYLYDGLGRNTTTIEPDPDGPSTGDDPAWTVNTYNAIGDVVEQENRLGYGTIFAYDNLHRLKTKLVPDTTTPTVYSYDEIGNLTKLTDPLLNVTDYLYDGLGRLTTERITLSGSPVDRVYSYDVSGNLVQKTDRNGRITKYAYDHLNRRTTEQWFNGSTLIRSIDSVFEERGFLETVKESTTSPSNPVYQYDYAYDQLGRSTAAKYDYKGSSATGIGQIAGGSTHFTAVVDASMKYDVFGRRSELAFSTTVGSTTTPDFKNVYTFDRGDRMTQATQDMQSGGADIQAKRVDFEYNDANQFTAINRYKDIAGGSTHLALTGTYTYDGAGRTTSMVYDKSSTVFAHYAWAYDEANRQTKFRVGTISTSPIGDDLDDNVANVDSVYDQQGQLMRAEYDPGATQYYYDDNGNRYVGGYTTDDYNRILSDDRYDYEHDAEGNVVVRTQQFTNATTDDRWYLEWDHRNRLTKITRQKWSYTSSAYVTEDVIEYDYDAFDRKIHKSKDIAAGGVNSNFDQFTFFDGTNPTFVYEDPDGVGSTAARRQLLMLFGPETDQLLSTERLTSGITSTLRTNWALIDNLGTVRMVRTRDGAVQTMNPRYYAFGETSNGNFGTWSIFGFTGQEYDPDTQLYHYNARWYSPVSGRFLSEDPLGLQPDENPFRYVKNGPANFTDPSGMEPPDGLGGVSDPFAGTQLSPSGGYNPDMQALMDRYKQEQENADFARKLDGYGQLPTPGLQISPDYSILSPVGPKTLAPTLPEDVPLLPGSPESNFWYDFKDAKPNWDDATGALVYSYQAMSICIKDKSRKTEIMDYIYQRLKRFDVFDNKIADATVVRQHGRTLVVFSPHGFLGQAQEKLKNGPMPVEVFSSDDNREVKGVTLGSHAIVGVRKWKVFATTQEGIGDIIVQTEAWEQRNGFFNNAAMWTPVIGGQEVMRAIWVAYLVNIGRDVKAQYGDEICKWKYLDSFAEYEMPYYKKTHPFREKWRHSPSDTPNPFRTR